MKLETKLKEIKERCNAATEGPWDAKYSEHMKGYENEDWILYSGKRNLCSQNYYSTPGILKEGDAQFIAHARTDVPMLLEMINALSLWLLEKDMPKIYEELEKIVEKYNG